MGLEQVVTEVRDGGERRAQEILAGAQTEADGIVAKAREQAAEYKAQRLAQAERDAEQIRRQAISNAQFEARKIVLKTEHELRTDLRGVIVDGLANLKTAARKKHITALLKQAEGVVGSGKVWGAKQDLDALAGGPYKVAGEADIAGGLIVESKDGTVRLDLSYETLLDDVWRNVLAQESGLFA